MPVSIRVLLAERATVTFGAAAVALAIRKSVNNFCARYADCHPSAGNGATGCSASPDSENAFVASTLPTDPPGGLVPLAGYDESSPESIGETALVVAPVELAAVPEPEEPPTPPQAVATSKTETKMRDRYTTREGKYCSIFFLLRSLWIRNEACDRLDLAALLSRASSGSSWTVNVKKTAVKRSLA